jgi:hypothetical protein
MNTGKRLKFLTNNFTLPAGHWQVQQHPGE